MIKPNIVYKDTTGMTNHMIKTVYIMMTMIMMMMVSSLAVGVSKYAAGDDIRE